jgi:hypothetical protein
MDDQIHGPGDAPEDRPPVDLGANRLLWIFAVGAIALLGTLAAAPLRDHRTEWRAIQRRYDAQAAQAGVPLVTEGVKQIWRPQLGVVDRCTSCHLGMGEAVPSPHERVFAPHPPVPHEPSEVGCTPSRATPTGDRRPST